MHAVCKYYPKVFQFGDVWRSKVPEVSARTLRYQPRSSDHKRPGSHGTSAETLRYDRVSSGRNRGLCSPTSRISSLLIDCSVEIGRRRPRRIGRLSGLQADVIHAFTPIDFLPSGAMRLVHKTEKAGMHDPGPRCRRRAHPTTTKPPPTAAMLLADRLPRCRLPVSY